MKATVLMAAMVAACGGSPSPAPVAQPTSAPAPAPVVVEPAKPAAAFDPKVALELMDRFGCVACHSTDGSTRVGPSFKHYFGATFTLADGTSAVGDEASFRASLTHARALQGFPASMPTYETLIKPEEADLLIAYVKSL